MTHPEDQEEQWEKQHVQNRQKVEENPYPPFSLSPFFVRELEKLAIPFVMEQGVNNGMSKELQMKGIKLAKLLLSDYEGSSMHCIHNGIYETRHVARYTINKTSFGQSNYWRRILILIIYLFIYLNLKINETRNGHSA